MIAHPKPAWTPRDEAVRDALSYIRRSGVCDVLRRATARRRGSGGRPASGISYSLEAVLVAIVLLVDKSSIPSIRAVLSCLVSEMTAAQREMLGMTAQVRVMTDTDLDREYDRFHKWLTRALAPMDSGFDLPARKVGVTQHRKMLADRSPKDRIRAKVAERLGTALINDLVAASVLDPAPDGYRGDVIADETIINVSNHNRKTADGDWMRSAVYSGAYYNHSSHEGDTRAKRGHGIGVTAVIRAGSPGTMNTVIPVVTAITVDPPSSGTPAYLEKALAQHRKHGFDARPPGKNGTYPFCVTDMGYTAKTNYAAILFRRQYAQISRFPRHHHHVHSLPGPRGEDTGVIQMGGDAYCPAAAGMSVAHSAMVIGSDGLDAAKADRHDRLLQQTHPYLMGRNSRLKRAGAPGRPRTGQPRQLQYRLELTCPAVQGRVRCPLKPESMDLPTGLAPEAAPDWAAQDKPACSRSTVTVTLPEMAFRQYHASLPATSWEHTFLYESYRSMTERTFSVLKSKHVSPCKQLEWAPKREPYLLLVLAISIGVMNLAVQASGARKNHANTFRRNMQDLAVLLGREPTRIPPRT